MPKNTTYDDIIIDSLFLRNTLVTMGVMFSAFLVIFVFCLKDFRDCFKTNRKKLGVLFVIFILGFWLRNSHYTLGMHTDGWVYAESAKYMLLKGIYVKDCAIGNLESCHLYEQVLAPPGYPFLISLAYQIFGINSYFAGVISGILSSLTIVLIFFIAKELFDENAGLLAAAIFAFFPYDLLFAGSGHARPTSLFFVSFALFLYLLTVKKNSLRLWFATALTLSMAVYIRQENIVLLFPMLLGLFVFNYFRRTEFMERSIIEKAKIFSKKIAFPALLFIVTQLPVQMWVINSKYAGHNLLEGKAIFL
ncbi:MAG: glycosyltransferase family 39 protein [Candidatus Diapherotrites archaeon]